MRNESVISKTGIIEIEYTVTIPEPLVSSLVRVAKIATSENIFKKCIKANFYKDKGEFKFELDKPEDGNFSRLKIDTPNKKFDIHLLMHYECLFYSHEIPVDKDIDFNEYFDIEFSKSRFLNLLKDELKKNTEIEESVYNELDIEWYADPGMLTLK